MAKEILEELAGRIGAAGVAHKGNIVKIGTLVSRVRFFKAPRFKKGMTLFAPVPWDKLREGRAGLRPAQLEATENFAKVASATRGWNLAARMATIGAALRRKDYGGKKRIPGKVPSEAEIAAVLRLV